uniref:Uncharacterized protein n=1 Tax=Arcella intermedia TaxID=1963864 RepID=A0A6B2LUW1_9EUKA
MSPSPQTTLKGQCFISCWTIGSEKLLPINRFTSKTVFSGTGQYEFFAAHPISFSLLSKAT